MPFPGRGLAHVPRFVRTQRDAQVALLGARLRGDSPTSAFSPSSVSDDDRAFFIQLGTRITRLRRAQGITQVQLAGQLGVSQQTVTAYESGNRRVPISHLPRLAALLGTTIEDLLGTPARHGKRGPAPRLQRQLEQLNRLPKAQQRLVSQLIDTVLQQQGG